MKKSTAIPGSVTGRGDSTYSYNKLVSATVPNSVTTLNPTAFHEQNPRGIYTYPKR